MHQTLIVPQYSLTLTTKFVLIVHFKVPHNKCKDAKNCWNYGVGRWSALPILRCRMERSSVRDEVPTREAAHFCHGKGKSVDSGKKLNEDPWKMPEELDHQVQLQPWGVLLLLLQRTPTLLSSSHCLNHLHSFSGRRRPRFPCSHFLSQSLPWDSNHSWVRSIHSLLPDRSREPISQLGHTQKGFNLPVFPLSLLYSHLLVKQTANPKYFLQIWVWKVTV